MIIQLVGQRLDSLRLQFGIIVSSVEMIRVSSKRQSSETGKVRLNWH